MLQSFFPVNNKVQTILIPDKTIVNSEIMWIQNFHIFWTFNVPTKTLGKVGEKQSIMNMSM